MVEDFWRRPFPGLLRPERWWPVEGGMMTRMPAVDVYEDNHDVVIKAEIPGLSKEDISVQVTDATLTIKGRRSAKKRSKKKTTIVANGPSVRLPGRWIYPAT
jgi:HSP20 family protein